MNKINRIIIAIFLVFIGGIASLHILSKDTEFSEAENRMLAEMPTFTFKRFASGDFTKEFEEYLSDQFVMKEFWTGLKAAAEKATGKRDNNGIYFGKDGYLFEDFQKPGEQLHKNNRSMTYFLEKVKDVPTHLMLLPTSVEIYPEKLPLFAETANQKEMLGNVKQALGDKLQWIDVYDALMHAKDQQIYFRTDHHWTTRGAHLAYKEAAKSLGFIPYERDDFEIKAVSTNFFGTHYSRAHDNSVRADTIEIFQPIFDVSYEVEIVGKGEKFDSLYDWDNLKKRDQYALFLHGNQSVVKIKSSVNNGRKLFVIKDSYAHAFVPFLANHFEEIHMIDMRYFKENPYTYMEENDLKEVLFVYNIVNYSKDTDLIWLRQ